ncbi:hypothetical protein B1B00_04280 [Bacillus sp. DSM 27956]|nr:hypothetical protein B1B00_04280 [Bacillus sp. DSM 27956]
MSEELYEVGFRNMMDEPRDLSPWLSKCTIHFYLLLYRVKKNYIILFFPELEEGIIEEKGLINGE